jgi:hypothetical protein
LRTGNLNFLRVSRQTLLSSPHPEIRALALAYHQQAAEYGNESDRAALTHLLLSTH